MSRVLLGGVAGTGGADVIDLIEPLEDPHDAMIAHGAKRIAGEVAVAAERKLYSRGVYSPNGLNGLGLVDTRTLFVSRYSSSVSRPSSRPKPDCL